MHEKVLSLEFIFQKILFYLYAFFYNTITIFYTSSS